MARNATGSFTSRRQISCLLQRFDRPVILFVQEQRQTGGQENGCGRLGVQSKAPSLPPRRLAPVARHRPAPRQGWRAPRRRWGRTRPPGGPTPIAASCSPSTDWASASTATRSRQPPGSTRALAPQPRRASGAPRRQGESRRRCCVHNIRRGAGIGRRGHRRIHRRARSLSGTARGRRRRPISPAGLCSACSARR